MSNAASTTWINPLSLHDALPIYRPAGQLLRAGRALAAGGARRLAGAAGAGCRGGDRRRVPAAGAGGLRARSEEHTSELQSPCNIVCRLMLAKKNKYKKINEEKYE